MENKKLLLGAFAFVTVATLSLTATHANQVDDLQDGRPELTTEQQTEKKAEREAHKAAIEAAVITNDFEAFKAVIEARHADNDKEANRPNDDRPELTEEERAEKIQKKFDKLTTYYAENGELPERKRMRKKFGNCDK